MKLSRFQPIFNGLNGVAKKVYDAVPISAPWSTQKIMRELERKGSHMGLKELQGCLGYMLSVGIIERDKEGEYIRTAIKIASQISEPPVTTSPPTEEETTMATNPVKNAPTTQPTVFDMLAKLAERAQDLSDTAEKLCEDIEKVALYAQSEQDKQGGELSKLRQLKALLSNLND